jgi:hypothetical protein
MKRLFILFQWHLGPSLPFGITKSYLVEDCNGGVILVGGESIENYYLTTLFRLPHSEAQWEKINQTLKIGRHSHAALIIPDAITDCTRSPEP